jgi:cell division protein FtsB
MTKKKLTLTPFARLFIVLLFVVPISYIGASYYNGEDGIQNIKDLFGIGQSKTETVQPATAEEESYDLKKENEQLRQQLENLKRENEQLRQQIENNN